MGIGGFTAAAAKVVLGVEGEQFSTGIRRAETEFGTAMGGMKTQLTELQERQLRASAAWDRYNAAVRRGGPATYEAKRALASLSAEQRRLTMSQEAGLTSAGRFERGMLAGSGVTRGMGRAVAFASMQFLGGAGLVFALKSAVDASQRFHGEMELLHTQALATQREVNGMTVAVMRLAPALGTGPQELAQGLYHVESAGLRGARALRVLTVAAQGARVGHANLEAVTNALVASQKSGIRGVQNMSQAMGALDAIIGTGNMRMEDLAGALSTGILPAARNFGLSLHDVGAALAVMTDSGVPAEEAATRLRMTFSLLGAQSPRAAKELQKIGFTSNQLGEEMRQHGLIPALQSLSDHLKQSGYDATEQKAILVRAFGGGRSSSAIITLLQQLGQVRMKFKMITEASGEFASRWHAEQQQAEFQFARLGATLEVMKIRVGNALLPTATSATKAIADWLAQSRNQQRVQRDVNQALHDGVIVAKLFAAGMHDLSQVMHGFDTVLGGSGRSLKLLLSFLVARKLIGFGRQLEASVLTKLDAVTLSAKNAAASLLGLGDATVTASAAASEQLVPSSEAAATAMRTEANAATQTTAAVEAQARATGTMADMATGTAFAGSTVAGRNPMFLGVGPSGRMRYRIPNGYRNIPPGAQAPLGEPTGTMADFPLGLASTTAAVSRGALARGAATRGLGLLRTHGVGAGLGLSLLGGLLPGGAGKLASDSGLGLMLGSFMRSPMAGLAVGAGMGIKHVIPGHTGSAIGNTAIGAGIGARLGTMIEPGLGTAVGGILGGAVGALLSFHRHTISAAEKLTELAAASNAAAKGVRGARGDYRDAIHNVHADRTNVDQAKAALEEAKAHVQAAKGADAHRVAVDELKVAQDTYATATRNLQTDLGALGNAHDTLIRKQNEARTAAAKVVDVFQQVGSEARNEGPKVEGLGRAASLHWPTASEKVHDYIEKMNSLGDSLVKSNPKMAAVAHQLALIALTANRLPKYKQIRVLMDYYAKLTIDEVIVRHGRRLHVQPGSVEGDKHNLLTEGPGQQNAGTVEQQARDYRAQQRADSAAAARKRAYSKAHPPFKTDMPTSYTEGELRAQISGSTSKLRSAYEAELAFWQNDLKNARNRDQRIIALQQIASVKSNLSGLASKSAHAAGEQLPGYGRYQDRINMAATTVSKADDLRALERAALFLDHYKGRKDISEKQRREAIKLLASVDKKIQSLSKAPAGSFGVLKTVTDAIRDMNHGSLPAAIAKAYTTAEQFKTKKDELTAATKERSYLEGIVHGPAKTPAAKRRQEEARKQLSKLDALVPRLSSTGGSNAFFSSDPRWLKLTAAVDTAGRTPKTADDIAALNAEQAFLQKFLQSHAVTTKLGHQANHLLTQIHDKLAKLTHTADEQLRAMEQMFLSEQASFFSSFGSNDFTTDSNGKRTMGSTGVRTVIVNQDLRTATTPDRHREGRMAARAAALAFG